MACEALSFAQLSLHFRSAFQVENLAGMIVIQRVSTNEKNKVADSSDEFDQGNVLPAILHPTNPLPVKLEYPASYLDSTAGNIPITAYR